MNQREHIERRRAAVEEIKRLPPSERLPAAKRLSDDAQAAQVEVWNEIPAELRARIAIAHADVQEYGRLYARLYDQRVRDMMFTPKDIGQKLDGFRVSGA